MQDIDRLFRHVARSLLAANPERLQQPVSISELISTLVPYRTSRRSLGVDSSEDYELLLLRFASGEGGFAHTQPDPVRLRFANEVRSPNPDLSVLREFRDAVFILQPAPLARMLTGASEDDAFVPPPRAPEPSPVEYADDVTGERAGDRGDRGAGGAPAPRHGAECTTVPARAGGTTGPGGDTRRDGAVQLLRRVAACRTRDPLLPALRAAPDPGTVPALQGGSGVRMAALRELRNRPQLGRVSGEPAQPSCRAPSKMTTADRANFSPDIESVHGTSFTSRSSVWPAPLAYQARPVGVFSGSA